MKYLKLFEAFEDADKKDYEGVFIMGIPDKEGYYTQSSKEDWEADRLNYERLVDFPVKRVDYINDKTVRKSWQGWRITRESGHNTAHCNDAYTNPTTGRRYTRSTWVLLSDDDWYEVQDVVQFGGRSLEQDWYRCDQWDGLLQLLKDKKIIK
jgi:hypothetical protein